METLPHTFGRSSSTKNTSSIADGWVAMIEASKLTIDMESLYVIFSEGGGPDSDGKRVLSSLLAALSRGVRVRVCVPWPSMSDNGAIDLITLQSAGASIGKVNWMNSTGTRGLAHGKFLIADSLHTYIGSADFSQPALSSIKQVGVIAWDCKQLAQDASRVFEQFYSLRD